MPSGKGEGITKIAVKGFKSIAEECEIDIRPLTILHCESRERQETPKQKHSLLQKRLA